MKKIIMFIFILAIAETLVSPLALSEVYRIAKKEFYETYSDKKVK